jgi:hypothetical protein
MEEAIILRVKNNTRFAAAKRVFVFMPVRPVRVWL